LGCAVFFIAHQDRARRFEIQIKMGFAFWIQSRDADFQAARFNILIAFLKAVPLFQGQPFYGRRRRSGLELA
jgi:hypothetical protein